MAQGLPPEVLADEGAVVVAWLSAVAVLSAVKEVVSCRPFSSGIMLCTNGTFSVVKLGDKNTLVAQGPRVGIRVECGIFF